MQAQFATDDGCGNNEDEPPSKAQRDSDDDNTCSDGDHDGDNCSIKQEPNDSLEPKTGDESGYTLDTETNKNLSSFLANLISAHSTDSPSATAPSAGNIKQRERTNASKLRWTPPPKIPKVRNL